MNNLWLTVEAAPGAEIMRTCEEAVALAEKTGLTIWFMFNGVKCLARAGDNPRGIFDEWNKQMALKGPHRIARDKGETPNVEVSGPEQAPLADGPTRPKG